MLTIYPEKHCPDATIFCKAFLDDTALPRYILGRNEYAASIAEHVDVNGFIDEFTDERIFLNKPVVNLEDVPKESLVVSVVAFVRPLIALNKLKFHSLTCLDYFSFMKYSGLVLKNIEFLNEGKDDIENHFDRYSSLYDCLADELSKTVLNNLLNFRYSSDLDYMREFKHSPEQQYFEDFLELKTGEVFVDAGGFDGQTAVEFIKRCPDYKAIHLFEPDPDNIEIARKNLSNYRNIFFYSIGLADCKKTLRFNSGEGSSSKVSEAGDIEVRVDAMDNLIDEPISIIKMDIEGAEGMALGGCREHILKDHPKLAICCYHKYDDIWKIPQQILDVRDDYLVYLRHYSEGFHETVMYFIPDA